MTQAVYVAPETLNEAIETLNKANGQAMVLAGGTDLIVQMRAEQIEPKTIVDIKQIPEISDINIYSGDVYIGAAVTGAELNENIEVKKLWPGVVEAMELIGSTQIQGRATIGGNLCNGSPAADTVPALIAADAVAKIASKNGIRELPVEQFLEGPGKSKLEVGEILVSLRLPKRQNRSSDSYLRFIPRTEMDIAAVGAGVNITLDNEDNCMKARIALGAVAEKAIRVHEAEAVLVGSKLDEETLTALSKKAMAACQPIDDKRGTKEFRIHVAGVLVSRAATIAFTRARSN